MRSSSQPRWLAIILILVMACGFLVGLAKPANATATWTQVNQNGFSSNNVQVNRMQMYNNYLYCYTGACKVLRYNTGTSWSQINPDRFNDPNNQSSGGMQVFDGKLYVGVYNDTTGAEVWALNGSTWTQVNTDGFGAGSTIYECLALAVYNNELYASGTTGGKFRVYKYSGSGTTWTQVDTGSWDNNNDAGMAMASWNGALWVCTSNTVSGAEVWRYNGTNWTQVNTNGFGKSDLECWTLAVYNNHLYAGTGNSPTRAKVYRYNSGSSWTQVNSNGFGSSYNYYASSLTAFNGKLWAGTLNNNSGCEVWSYNGSQWARENGDGFGTVYCYGVNCMADYNSRLYVGTLTSFMLGAQIWSTNGSPAPENASSFYFAEGYTGTNFAEYLCLGNPNNVKATANVTYLFSDGTTKAASYNVPATGRYTVNVNSEVGANKEVSIQVQSQTANLVAERPMYFNYNGVWTGGSDAVGATAPNTKWYFAEGNTLPEFDQYVTVLNPTGSAANLTFRYMVEGTGEKDVSGSVGAHSRATFKTRDQIGPGLNASLYLSSDQAVVAERPMYFNYQGLASNNWTGGHDVVGTNSPQKQWYLAEGTTRGGFEEWLCLENSGGSPITVNATYQLGTGQGNPINKSYTVPAKQRLTVSVNREIGPEKDDSVFLSSTSAFIAERPMYFNYQGKWTGGHDVLGANNSAKTWFFAEGTTRTNFEEWLCLQNPGNAETNTTITYYTAAGQAINKTWHVDANSRLTVNVNQDAGANQDISAKVSSDQPIIVERPMYFDYNGWTGGHDVVGFVPQ